MHMITVFFTNLVFDTVIECNMIDGWLYVAAQCLCCPMWYTLLTQMVHVMCCIVNTVSLSIHPVAFCTIC